MSPFNLNCYKYSKFKLFLLNSPYSSCSHIFSYMKQMTNLSVRRMFMFLSSGHVNSIFTWYVKWSMYLVSHYSRAINPLSSILDPNFIQHQCWIYTYIIIIKMLCTALVVDRFNGEVKHSSAKGKLFVVLSHLQLFIYLIF